MPNTKKSIKNLNKKTKKCYLTPLTPQQAIFLYNNLLSEADKCEMKTYDEIFYLGAKAHKLKHSKVLISNSSLKFSVNDHISYRYQVIDFLGNGTFGAVLKTFDHELVQHNAVKIIKTDEYCFTAIKQEIKILTHIKENDPNKLFNCIQYNTYFSHRGFVCISFPLMGRNIYDILKSQHFKGFDQDTIKSYATDILCGLVFLHKENIIHCDLKPENILVEYNNSKKVKIADFGSSYFQKDCVENYIQSRYYRSPETILGFKCTPAIDIWSFGCILYEMAIGSPLFCGENEFDQLSAIIEVKGVPPKELVCSSTLKTKYFLDSYVPKYCVVYIDKSIIKCSNTKNKSGIIRKLPGFKPYRYKLTKLDYDEDFIDMIDCSLWYNQDERASALELLLKSWVNFDLNKSKIHDYVIENYKENIKIVQVINSSENDNLCYTHKKSASTLSIFNSNPSTSDENSNINYLEHSSTCSLSSNNKNTNFNSIHNVKFLQFTIVIF